MGRTRLGVFGGTFDPLHIAHLVVAQEVRYALGLDQVLLVVANEPWQKVDERHVTAAADRLAMVEAAVAGVDGLDASAIEIDRGGPSYTADTLAELAASGESELFVIIGADVDIDTWERADDVRRLAEIVVVTRPGQPLRGGLTAVEIPALDISASDLRQRLAEGRPVDYLIPEPVLRCIRDRGLYAGGG